MQPVHGRRRLYGNGAEPAEGRSGRYLLRIVIHILWEQTRAPCRRCGAGFRL